MENVENLEKQGENEKKILLGSGKNKENLFLANMRC